MHIVSVLFRIMLRQGFVRLGRWLVSAVESEWQHDER